MPRIPTDCCHQCECCKYDDAFFYGDDQPIIDTFTTELISMPGDK